MRMKVKSLTISNFKGIRRQRVEFSAGETVISGENGSGKTTVLDAFSWLLFDKDSAGSSSFNLKTLDSNNRVIPQIEHEVEGVIDTGYEVVTLRKILREKWQKKRGSIEPEFTGNETLYFYNDVPLKQGEYKMKVDGMLKEELFKLITSPFYFNSLKWQDRRGVLTKMAGTISDSDIAGLKPAFRDLLLLLGSKTFDEYKREIAVRKKKLNDELKLIPSRIDEQERSKPEAVDYQAVNLSVAQLQGRIAAIEEQISDRGKQLEVFFEGKQKKQEALNQLLQQRSLMETDAQNEANQKNKQQSAGVEDVRFEIKALENIMQNAGEEYKRLEREKEAKAARLEGLDAQIVLLRQKWEAENAKVLVWNEQEFLCPCCHRPFEASDVEAKKDEMLKNFNEAKNKTLDGINEEGIGIKKEILLIQQQISRVKVDLEQVAAEQARREKQLSLLKDKVSSESSLIKPYVASELLAANTDYFKLKCQIEDLKEEISLMQPSGDTTDLKEQKALLQQQVDAARQTLASKDQLDKICARIEELKKEEQSLSQQIADLEKSEFVMQEFTKAKVDAIEARINGLFSLVKFKMFETQINGGEVETCECTVNGVPYSDLNTASKINAGLDIINALCTYYQVSAPVFIDGRESVNSIIPVSSQLINLVVSKEPFTVTHLN